MDMGNYRSTTLTDLPKTANQSPKLFKLLIFDFDGVLVDTQGIVNKIQYEYIKRQYGLDMSLEDYADRFSGMRVETIVELLQQDKNFTFPQSPKEISQNIDEIVLERLSSQEISPLPGVVDFLRNSPLKRCVASNCTYRLLKVFLKSSHLIDFFNGDIFSAEMVKQPKPAPDLFLYAAQKMGENPSDCLVVEDSVAGAQAAFKAGIKVAGFLAGSHMTPSNEDRLLQAGAEAVLHDMRHLSTYLSQGTHAKLKKA